MNKIRHAKKDDYAGIHEVNRRAFGREAEADLVDKLRLAPAYVAELEYVAESKDRIVGHVFFSMAHIRTEMESIPVLALAPMAVLPECQHKGIGYNLLTEALKKAKSLGYRAVIVVGHPGYYSRFGFRRLNEKQHLILKWKVPPENFMILELIPGSLEMIKGEVEYPAEFDKIAA